MRRTAIIIFTQMLVAASFLSAKPTTEAQTLPTVTGDPVPGIPGYRGELGLSPSSGQILELLVYHGQKQVQALKVCTPEPVPRESPVGTMYTTDFNFDGYGDLALETAFKQSNASYCIWLYNPKTKRFVFSDQLSKLANPSADAKTKTVVSYSRGECEPCYRRETYGWSKGQLVPVREESIAPADLGLQLPGGCGWLKTVREEKNGKMVFVSRNQVNSLGVACLPGHR